MEDSSNSIINNYLLLNVQADSLQQFKKFRPKKEGSKYILNLSCESMNFINPKIFCEINITNLCLSHNKITTIPAEIKNLKNLKFLNLNYNNLTEIPYEIGELYNLESASFDGNNLIKIDGSIGYLNNLNYLSVQLNSSLKELPKSIVFSSNIRIYFGGTKIPFKTINEYMFHYLLIQKNRKIKNLENRIEELEN